VHPFIVCLGMGKAHALIMRAAHRANVFDRGKLVVARTNHIVQEIAIRASDVSIDDCGNFVGSEHFIFLYHAR